MSVPPHLETAAAGHQVVQIDVSTIEPNPHQPRMEFDPETVDELAQSIREKGIIQPITVRLAFSTATGRASSNRRSESPLQIPTRHCASSASVS